MIFIHENSTKYNQLYNKAPINVNPILLYCKNIPILLYCEKNLVSVIYMDEILRLRCTTFGNANYMARHKKARYSTNKAVCLITD